ncbi:hypothetical protein IBX35_01115 [Candidatus Bathyarchaeota archaeon]|nr:hypothetical protein [Candidatus Bathyarchaeota archaeon]
MDNMRRWKKDDVEELRRLVEGKQSWQVIAAELKRSVDAVRMKAKRLGLSVVVDRGRGSTTTNDLPEELPSVEEALKVLARVLKAFDQPGLEMSEVQRLQAMVSTIRTYEGMLANYMRYREIEKRLVGLEAKYARLVREKA